MLSIWHLFGCAAVVAVAWTDPARAAFIIDTFDVTPLTAHASGSGGAHSYNSGTAPEAIGGQREITADLQGSGSTRATANVDVPGRFALVNGASNGGVGTVGWGTAGSGLNLDLTEGGANTKFVLSISPGAQSLDFIVHEGQFERASVITVSAPSGVVSLPFADFGAQAPKPAADFITADFLFLTVRGFAGTTVSVDWVRVVPEPSALLLLVAGAAVVLPRRGGARTSRNAFRMYRIPR